MDKLVRKLLKRLVLSTSTLVISMLLLPVFALAAVSINVPSTDADGTFTINWTGVSSFATLYQNESSIDGNLQPPGGARTFTALENGTYTFRVDNWCQVGQSVKVCNSASGTIVVSRPASSVATTSKSSSSAAVSSLPISSSPATSSARSSSVSSVMATSSKASSAVVVSSSPAISTVSSSSSSVLSAPNTPSSITVSVSGPNVAISWVPSPTGASPTYYSLLRNSSGLDNWNSTSYSDTTATPGTAYTYSVQACNSAGCSSARVASSSVTVPVRPATPIGFSATPSGNSISISWAPSNGAQSYELQRNSSPLATLIGLNQTGYSDSTVVPGVNYTYQVKACNPTGCSNWATGNAVGISSSAASSSSAATSSRSSVASLASSSNSFSSAVISSASSSSRSSVVSSVALTSSSSSRSSSSAASSSSAFVCAASVSSGSSIGIYVPATDDDGNFRVCWNGSYQYAQLKWKEVNGTFTEIPAVGLSYVDITGKQPGIYTYRVEAFCQDGVRGGGCGEPEATIVVGNVAPIVLPISTVTVNEDAITSVPFTIIYPETLAGSFTFDVASSNPALISNASLKVSGTGLNRALEIAPVANAYGTSEISLTVRYGTAASTIKFNVTVNSVNDPPAMSAIPDLVVDENGVSNPFVFTITDDQPLNANAISVVTSDNFVIPPANVSLVRDSIDPTKYTLVVTAGANKTGSANVTLNVFDGEFQAARSFKVTINDLPPTLSVDSHDGQGKYVVSWKNAPYATRLFEKRNTGLSAQLITGNGPSGTMSFDKKLDGLYTYELYACKYTPAEDCTTLADTKIVNVVLPVPAIPVVSVSPATTSTGEFQVTWTPVDFANSYQLYENNELVSSGGLSTSKIYQGATAKSANQYSYKVKACNASGCSGESEPKIVTVTTNSTSSSSVTTSVATSLSRSSTSISASASFSSSSRSGKRYEAEAATQLSGVAVLRENSGYSGTGYGDYDASLGSFIEWTIDQTVAGSAQVLVRYSNGNAPSRPMDLFVNGVKAGSKTFASTKAWTTWGDELFSVTLRAGANKIKLIAATSAAGSNIDYIDIFASQAQTSSSFSASSINVVATGSAFLQTTKNQLPIDPGADAMGEGAFTGTLSGNEGVGADGSFSYALPVALPAGINGAQPKLQLAYSSNQKNGLLGWGWSLSGLSVISRCNASMIRDGFTSGIQAGDNYKYCLDGQRLVEVSSGEYRTESESFLRIKKLGDYWEVTTNSGTTSRYGYNADSKLADDQSQTYAWYMSSLQDVAGNSWTVTYLKTESNGIQSHYPDAISYKIDPIFGALNTVKFIYESREDIALKYVAGMRVKTDKRLAKIEIKSAGTTVSSYTLAYQQAGQLYQGKPYSDPAKTSRLARIIQCGAYGCSAPVEFDWNLQTAENYRLTQVDRTEPVTPNTAWLDVNGDGVLEPNTTVLPEATPTGDAGTASYVPAAKLKPLDMNQDGRDDIVWIGSTGLKVFLSNGTEIKQTPEPGFEIPVSQISFPSTVSYTYLAIGLLNPTTPGVGESQFYKLQYVDMNADGLVDVVRAPNCSRGFTYEACSYSASPNDISVALNDKGTGFLPFQVWQHGLHYGSLDNHSLQFVDLNGNGSKDLIAPVDFRTSITSLPLFFGIGNGTGGPGSLGMYGPYALNALGMLGDFNGDGITDMAKLPTAPNGNITSGEAGAFSVALGVGKFVSSGAEIPGFRTPVVTAIGNKYLRFCGLEAFPDSSSATTYDGCGRSVVDFNGDGLDDIIEAGRRVVRRCLNPLNGPLNGDCKEREETVVDTEARVYLSLGADAQGNPSFAAPLTYRTWSDFQWATANLDPILVRFASLKFDDYDNNGTLEDHYRLKNNVISNRIEAVLESTRRIDVKYSPLASNKIYEVIPSDTVLEDELGYVKQTKTLAKRLGVNEIQITNGAGGTNKTKYTYSGAKTHGAGYGELGFSQIDKLEMVEGKTPLKTITTYYQKADSADYKLAGKVKREVVYTSNEYGSHGVLLSDSRYQWKVRIYKDDLDAIYKSPHYFAYLYQSSNQSWDLDGTLISETLTQNRFDAVQSCTRISSTPMIIVTNAGSGADNDFTADGVLVYSQTATCDQSGSSASVQIKAMENLEVTSKGNARALVQKQKAYAWTGNSIGAATKSAFAVRAQAFSYNSLGQLESKTIEPEATAASALKHTTTYGYNSYGSVNSVTESWDDTANDGLDIVTRTTSIVENYDSAGVRTLEVTSPLNLKETTKYHAVWGLPVSEVDANGLETKRDYDAYGRPQLITYADNTTTTIDYRSCSGCSLYYPNAKWYQQVKTTGSSAVRTYYDGFNREIGSRSKGLNGQDVYTLQSYNSRGSVYQTTEPFYYGGSQQTVTRNYDALGRIASVQHPDGTSEAYAYSGLRHTTTNRLNQTQTRYLNAAGWVMQSRDNTNTPVDFTYWPWGDLKTTQVNSDSKTLVSVVYDGLGRKTEMTDPNTGKTVYTYNALGLIATQMDAKNQRTCFGYDALGRQVKRVDKASSSCTGTTQNWYYDSSAYGKGQLASMSGASTDGSNYSESYSYTNKGLPATTTYNLGFNSYSITQHYDNFSRPLGVTYPTGYVVANRYNSYGHLNEVMDSAGTRVWKADDADALGNLKQFTLGNGTVTTQTYDTNNNRIETIRAVKGSVVIQDQRYQFDSLGNLKSREDRKNSVTQSFCYDGLNRLKAARFSGCSSASNDFNYDALGNITARDNMSGSLVYGTNGTNVAGPHAVTSANGWTYKYDAIGNLESATKAGQATRTVQYSPFNTPTSIVQGANSSTIVYGPNQDRIQHSDSNGRVTNYVGGIYEEVTLNGETQKIHYVGDMALFITKGDNTNATYGYEYLHRDHVGSIVARSKGTVNSALDVDWQANGAWGERRYQQWNGPLDNLLIPSSTARGFTDHEHLDSVGLIHMNGRVYDPELGRFLSADPFVQAPYNTQSYNRYSYVFNNPLSFTDPSGYECYQYRTSNDSGESRTGTTGDCTASYTGMGAYYFSQDWMNAVDRSFQFVVEQGFEFSGIPTVFNTVIDVQIAINMGDYSEAGSKVLEGAVELGTKKIEKVAKIAEVAKTLEKKVGKALNKEPTLGGGATLDKLTASERTRIQNAANRSGQEITVVGSRVNPEKQLHSKSDYDYVVDAKASTRNSLSRSLPGAGDIKEGIPKNIDIFKGEVDLTLPHVTFYPQ